VAINATAMIIQPKDKEPFLKANDVFTKRKIPKSSIKSATMYPLFRMFSNKDVVPKITGRIKEKKQRIDAK